MKHIQKNDQNNFDNIMNGKTSSNWNDFVECEKDKYLGIVDILEKEQDYRCCYCEKKLTDSDRHIEHFKPKSEPRFKNLTFIYTNLLLSCHGKLGKRKQKNHCGHKKDNKVISLNPLNKTHCQELYILANGEIKSIDDKFKEDIKTLKLNTKELVEKRKNIFDNFIDNSKAIHSCHLKFYSRELSKCNEIYDGFYSTVLAAIKSIFPDFEIP